MPIKRNLNTFIDSIKEANINKQSSSKKSYDVEGLLKPEMKDGKFEITLRFLPPHASETMSYIENRKHLFKLSNGKWFGSDCNKKFTDPTNPAKKCACPICDFNAKAWEKYKDVPGAYAQHKLGTARPEYFCNVLVVRNDNQPTTEGQVFRFKFGKKIKDMIDKSVQDHDEDENGEVIPGINPFSWYGPQDQCVISGEERAGANFVWKAVQGSNGPNYDDSHFNKPSRISKCIDGVNSQGQPCKKFVALTDEEIDAVESRLYTLKDIETKYEDVRPYSETVKFFEQKAGYGLFDEFDDGETNYTSTTKTYNVAASEDDDDLFSGIKSEPVKPAAAPAPAPKPAAPKEDVVEDPDDFFARMNEL